MISSNVWSNCERTARQMGGHLATVRNATEESWIYTTFSHYGGTNRNLWIGLYDPDPSTNSADRTQRRTEFKWISGEPVTYSNWSPVEPNNSLSNDISVPELYCHIWNPSDPYASFWNNYGNTSANEFNIELDGVVEIVPPVVHLQISALEPSEAILSWPSLANKNYQFIAVTDLFAPMPTNLVKAVGGNGTVSYLPSTDTLLNSAWTNFGSLIPGNGAIKTVFDNLDQRVKFYQIIAYP